MAAGKSTSTNELLAEAREKAESYDYDGALGLLREAERTSGGAPEAVRELARFLVESYGQYEEAVTLLERHAALTGKDRELTRLLADALYNSGDTGAALAPYERVVSHRSYEDDAEVWTRLGLLREQGGEDEGALEAFRAALRVAPGGRTAQEHADAITARMSGASAEQVASARAAFEAGDVAQARTLLDEVLSGPQHGPEAAALLREIQTRERDQRLEQLMDAAGDAEQAGDLDSALERWREATRVDPDCIGAREALARLEQERARQRFDERIARGQAAIADDRLEDAVQAFYRAHAVRPDGAAAPTGGVGDKLYRITADFLEQMGARNLERAAGGLAALCRAENALDEGDEALAEELARGAAPALGGFGRLETLRGRLAAGARQKEETRAQALYEQACAQENTDPEAALALFDRLLREHSAGFADAGERAGRIRDQLRREADGRRQREQLRELAEAEDWFALRRAWRTAAEDVKEDEALAALVDEAAAGITARYPAALSPPPWIEDEDLGRELDSRACGLPDLDPEHARVLFDTAGGKALVLSGPLLVSVDLAQMAPQVVADLTPGLSFGDQGQLLLAGRHPAGGSRIAVLNEDEAQLLLVRVDEGTVEVEDRVDVSAIVPARRKDTLRYYGLHDESGRLVQLDTKRDSNGPTTLRNLELDSGRVVHEEQFNYGLWNLRRDPSGDEFLVNRVFDPRMRWHPSYFVFAAMDYRGRLLRRHNPSPRDLPEPVERIVSLARSESLGRTFVTYDYFDALGSTVRGRPALLVLKGDSEVFYQSPAPEKLLTGRRLPRGTVRVIEAPGERPLLVLPYTDADGHVGLTMLDAESLEPRFDADLDKDERLVALRPTPDHAGLLAFTFPYGDGGWRLRRLDVATEGWARG